MDEKEMLLGGQKPSASSQAGLSKKMIIVISVIIGGGLLVIGLAVGLGVGLGVRLNTVETASASIADETKSITVENDTWPAPIATSSIGTTTTTTNDTVLTTSIATSMDVTSAATLLRPPASTVIQETAPTPEAKMKEMKTTETTTPSSTGTDSTANSVAAYFNTNQCEFNVGGICYWSYVNSTNSINFTEAQQICADKGSVPAYFPTELAYNKTVESVRVKIIADRRTGSSVYTGVMIDDQTLGVIYPNTEIYMKWSPGYPRSHNDYTSVFVQIRSSLQDIYQGMLNYTPGYRAFGVVCQNNLN